MKYLDISIQGYNCSIFAYGQTGAGKTYSIMGNLDDLQSNIYCESRGILPRIIEDIVKELNTDKHQEYTLTCSYIEIYNEQIFDLVLVYLCSFQVIKDLIKLGRVKKEFLLKV